MTSIILVSVLIIGFSHFGSDLFALYGKDLGNESKYFDTSKNGTTFMEITTKDMENKLEGKEPAQDVEEKTDIYAMLWDVVKSPLAIFKPIWALSYDMARVLGLPSWSYPLAIIPIIVIVLIIIGAAWRHYI